MMHYGTNDVWHNVATDAILPAFSKLLQQMRANNPNVKLLVAQIIPMDPHNCYDCGDRAKELNAAIPAWAAQESRVGSEVYVVDQWTGFDTKTDTIDGVHPNDAGNAKIAAKWQEVLVNVLKK